jgi:hypothetical protein
MDLTQLIEFAKWKRTHKAEYEELIADIEAIMKDLNGVMKRVMDDA